MDANTREEFEGVIGKITDELEELNKRDSLYVSVVRCIRLLSEIRMALNRIAQGLDAEAEREEAARGR